MESRSKKSLYLIDHIEIQIVGAKLPSNGQVLRVLFYNMQIVNLHFHESAHLVVKEVEVFWEKARIPTRKNQRCIEKLETLYNEYKLLKKSCNRKSQLQEDRENEFLGKLNDLFDIAHGDAFQLIKIEEDREFLINQRKKCRQGSMIGIDRALVEKVKKELCIGNSRRNADILGGC